MKSKWDASHAAVCKPGGKWCISSFGFRCAKLWCNFDWFISKKKKKKRSKVMLYVDPFSWHEKIKIKIKLLLTCNNQSEVIKGKSACHVIDLKSRGSANFVHRRRSHDSQSKTHLTFSGSWDSTSFFSLRSRNGRSTLCRRRMIRMVSSSLRSTYKK